MKTKSIILLLVSICLFSACSEEDMMQTGAEDKGMNRVQLRVPTTVGKDLHTK